MKLLPLPLCHAGPDERLHSRSGLEPAAQAGLLPEATGGVVQFVRVTLEPLDRITEPNSTGEARGIAELKENKR